MATAKPAGFTSSPPAPLAEKTFPRHRQIVHAADWHEREAEDLFGLLFEGHPRLGDFILHDDAWQENVEPMRRHFDAQAAMLHRKPDADWRPRRIVQEAGAFVMPSPEIFRRNRVRSFSARNRRRRRHSFHAAPVLQVASNRKTRRRQKRRTKFYWSRNDSRNDGFCHGLAYCQAVERICGAKIPARAKILRVFLANWKLASTRRSHSGNL